MKTKLNTNNILRFNAELFFNILLGFSPTWYYKSNQIHISEKIININPKDKIQSKFNCINGSILNVAREPILYSFDLNKSPGYFEPETKH